MPRFRYLIGIEAIYYLCAHCCLFVSLESLDFIAKLSYFNSFCSVIFRLSVSSSTSCAVKKHGSLIVTTDHYHNDFVLSIPCFGIRSCKMEARRRTGSERLRRLGLLPRKYCNPSYLQETTRLVLLQYADRDLGLCKQRSRYRIKVLPARFSFPVVACLACFPFIPSGWLVLLCSSTASSAVLPATSSQSEPKGSALDSGHDYSGRYSHDRPVLGCRLACLGHCSSKIVSVVAKGSNRGSLHSTPLHLC